MDSEDIPLTSAQVRGRAIQATRLVLMRGVAIRAISLIGGLVFARVLGPEAFGAVAVGLIFVAFGTLIADGGLGAALIRRSRPPSEAELASLVGWQLALVGALVCGCAVVAPRFGQTGMVTLIMASSMLLTVLQVPGAIMLERQLKYGPRILVELAEAGAWLISGLTLVLLGADVWGLAWASVIRSGAGALAMRFVQPVPIRPRLSFVQIKHLIGFGARFQAVGAVNLLRDQGLNLLVLRLGGLQSLGVWALAFRVMQLPYLVLDSLWRVSYPAMARLLETGDDVRAVVSQVVAMITLANGLVLVLVAGAADPFIPLAFGSEWAAATDIVAPACLALLLGGGPSVAGAGLLYAKGRANLMLAAAVLHTVAWLGGTALLWQSLGLAAIGWGWLLSAVAELIVLGWVLFRSFAVNVVVSMVRPLLVAAISAGALALGAELAAGDGMRTIGALVVAAVVYAFGARLLMPRESTRLVSLGVGQSVFPR